MTRLANTARNLLSTFGKFGAGFPDEGEPVGAKLSNVSNAAWFLLARKLGVHGKPHLMSRRAGRTHRWDLVERSDLGVIEEVFIDRVYALDIAPPKVVFDLGANIGAASVFFAQTWPGARIIAVEPSPAVFERLKDNTKDYPQITCLNYAACGQDGEIEFVMSTDHIASSLRRPDPNGSRIKVAARTLRSIMAEVGVDRVNVLKFDIEGAEEDLIASRSDLDVVDACVGEVHRDMLGVSEAEFLARFDAFRLERRFEAANEFLIVGLRPQ